jgi:serine/threonine protein kinase
MKPGQKIKDSQANSWELTQLLGRGLWGTSWLAKDKEGAQRVIKISLLASEFPADVPLPDDIVQTCSDIVTAQAELLKKGTLAFLPKFDDHTTTKEYSALWMPYYPSSLEKKFLTSTSFEEVLTLFSQLLKDLEHLTRNGMPHGNLHPRNILINERGEPVLADLLIGPAVTHYAALSELGATPTDYRLPEGYGQPNGQWDTWAICMALYRCAMQTTDEFPPHLELPTTGLGKVALANLRNHVLARLKQEDANPRFSARVADKVASLLNRGLSNAAEPSPPYRFISARFLIPRLDEILALLNPHIDSVGRVLLGPSASAGTFQDGDEVTFSVTVASSTGLRGHEDIATGIQVVDLDTVDEDRIPIPDARFTVSQHPSGRLRFLFTIPALGPGRFGVHVAFSVKGSDEEPKVVEGEFEIRPTPGYIPPIEEEEEILAPIPMIPRIEAPEPQEDLLQEDESDVDLDVEPLQAPEHPSLTRLLSIDAGGIPTPVAPSAPGTIPNRPSVIKTAPQPIASAPAIETPPLVLLESKAPVAPIKKLPKPNVVFSSPATTPTIAPAEFAPEPVPAEPALPIPIEVDAMPAEPTMNISADNAPVTIGPGQWEELPEPVLSDGLEEQSPLLPGANDGEDLPGWDLKRASPLQGGLRLSNWAAKVFDFIRKDAYTAYMIVISSALMVLVLLFLAMQFCSTP